MSSPNETTEKKTSTASYLTEAQVRFFKDQGYLVVRNMFDDAEMADITRWVDELTAMPEVPGKYMFYFEESRKDKSRIQNRAEYFTEYHKELGELARHPRIMSSLAQLMDDEAILFKDKINYKLPGGDGFKAHQDIQAAWDDFTDYFISMSITVDEHTVENGCFEICGGHHLRGMFGRRFEPLTEDDLKGIAFEAVPTRPGDVVFFDCYAPHKSEPNMTDKKRRNIFLTYNRKSDGDFRKAYFEEKRRNYPPDVEREAGKSYRFKV